MNEEEKNNQKEEIRNQKEDNNNSLKKGFFKKLWYSITNIEKYPDMAAEGVKRAISYMAKIVVLIAIVIGLGSIYQAYNMVKEGINYLENEFPEFSYKDEVLDVKTEEPLTIDEENSVVGKVIIDTKTDDESQINTYINSLEEYGEGVIILKNKAIVKSAAVAGTMNYEYNQILGEMGITEFTKQDVINYANSSQIVNLYVSIFLTIFIYAFVMYFFDTFVNTVLLSIVGLFTQWIAKIKMRYAAIFNMSVYALTLSILLNILYIGINIFVEFNIEYFQVMYVAVAAIYLIAAIFILKTEFVKKQMELMKIAEAQEIVKKELEEQELDEQREKEKQERRKKDKEKEENKDGKEEKQDNEGGAAEGSNA